MEVALVGKIRRASSIELRGSPGARVELQEFPISVVLPAEVLNGTPLKVGGVLKVKGRFVSKGDRPTVWGESVSQAEGSAAAFFTLRGRVEEVENGYGLLAESGKQEARWRIEFSGIGIPDPKKLTGRLIEVQGEVLFREEEDEFLHTRIKVHFHARRIGVA